MIQVAFNKEIYKKISDMQVERLSTAYKNCGIYNLLESHHLHFNGFDLCPPPYAIVYNNVAAKLRKTMNSISRKLTDWNFMDHTGVEFLQSLSYMEREALLEFAEHKLAFMIAKDKDYFSRGQTIFRIDKPTPEDLEKKQKMLAYIGRFPIEKNDFLVKYIIDHVTNMAIF